MSMMQTYKNITKRSIGNRVALIQGHEFAVLSDCKNDYHTDRLAIIPAGSTIIADFAGDFGMYGMVEVSGALHKVKVLLEELCNVDFGPFDARRDDYIATAMVPFDEPDDIEATEADADEIAA